LNYCSDELQRTRLPNASPKKEAEYAALIKRGDAALGSKKFDDAKAK